MKTAAYVGNRTIEVSEAERPEPGPGQARVRVSHVGLCGTDLHVFHGDMDARVTIPAILGHEMSGTIDALGPEATGHAPGDAVTVLPLAWDGTCPACRAGNEHICQHLDFIGVDTPGALQEYWIVDATTLVAIPAGVPGRDAALVEPVAVAVHDVRRGEVAPGDAVVVIGGGPIGSLIATVARHAGARVAVAEIDAARREAVARLGFETIDPGGDPAGDPDNDPAAWVDRWTGGAGADVVFEVSGSEAGVLTATALAKVRGTVVVVAIHPRPRPVDLHRVFWRELRILGARVYQRADFETAIGLVADGTVPVDDLVSAVVPIEELAGAFGKLERGEAMKILVSVGESSAGESGAGESGAGESTDEGARR
jgi:2-desacetyl-2-hydroxyethyl bacteriochlorophyllide A dehydrogenase